MKKVIAILTVLALLVSAAFAAETHTIRVKADVTEVLPAFQLKFSGAETNKATSGENPTPSAEVDLATDHDYKDLSTKPELSFNLDSAGNFTVTAYVVNNVKSNNSYKLEFSGGVFAVKRNKTAGSYSPSEIKVTNGTVAKGVKEYGTATTATNTDSTADTTDSLKANTTVTFSGETGAGATTAIKVAEAKFSYPGDEKIDPNAANQFYEADVVMTITANT